MCLLAVSVLKGIANNEEYDILTPAIASLTRLHGWANAV